MGDGAGGRGGEEGKRGDAERHDNQGSDNRGSSEGVRTVQRNN